MSHEPTLSAIRVVRKTGQRTRVPASNDDPPYPRSTRYRTFHQTTDPNQGNTSIRNKDREGPEGKTSQINIATGQSKSKILKLLLGIVKDIFGGQTSDLSADPIKGERESFRRIILPLGAICVSVTNAKNATSVTLARRRRDAW